MVQFEEIYPATTTMQCHKSVEYNRATVKVQNWVVSGTPPPIWEAGRAFVDRDVEEAVVHELLHCVTSRYWCWSTLLRDETHRDALDVARRAFDAVDENIIDCLAVALVKAWPSNR